MKHEEQKERKAPRFTRYALHLTLAMATFCFSTFLPAQAQENGAAPQKLNPYTGKTEAITEGQTLFKKYNCYACHGMAGGGGMGPNLTDENWQNGDGSDLSILTQIQEGKGSMPPFKTMITDDEAWKIIAFVRSLYKGSPEKIKW